MCGGYYCVVVDVCWLDGYEVKFSGLYCYVGGWVVGISGVDEYDCEFLFFDVF